MMTENELMRDIFKEHIKEQRSKRRWGIFFKGAFLVYLGFLFFLAPDTGISKLTKSSHVGLIDIQGVIAADSPANAETVVQGLRQAFEAEKAQAVLLRINSPGGSPVESGLIHDEIVRLREKYPNKKVYAAVTDMAASGGYYIAVAADQIYADKASIVGSIGVIAPVMGFTELMNKIGVERRTLTSGKHKAMYDPTAPVKPEEQAWFQAILDNVHQQFIAVVKSGRGDRLAKDPEIFSGLMWTGEQAVKIGVIDGLGSPGYVAREIIGNEVVIDYTPHPDFFEQIAHRFGIMAKNSMQSFLEVTLR
jgi:protease-4